MILKATYFRAKQNTVIQKGLLFHIKFLISFCEFHIGI
jgi:hypothetical protein